MHRPISRFLRHDGGGVMILAAFALPLGLAAVGAAVTYSNVTATRGSYQKALDAAVLAGTILPMSAAASERIKAAELAFAGGMTSQVRSVTIGSTAKFKVEAIGTGDVKVTGEAGAQVKNLFAGLIGADSIAIGVHSAARKGQSDPICLLALNAKEQGAVDLNGTVDVSTNCPAQANSSDGAAVRQVGNARMNTAVFAVTGNYRGGNFSPKPVTGSERVADPLANVPFPTPGPCIDLGLKGSGKLQQENLTLSPGTYCGGLDITADSKIRLQPGEYIIKDGELKISGSVVTGTEVMIAFTGKGAKLWLTGGAVMKVTSPSSGPYMNMQFMEDRNNGAGNMWVSIGGDSKLDYDGTMYFPNSNIWIFGGSEVTARSPNLIMIGDKVWFQDNSKVVLKQENTRNLPVKESPRLKLGAKLRGVSGACVTTLRALPRLTTWWRRLTGRG
jgi:Flp pilus assembly protein TadG